MLCITWIRRTDRGKVFLPAVTQRTNCQKLYLCSELNVKEEVIFRSFTQQKQTSAVQWCTGELTAYVGSIFIASAAERALAGPSCPTKTSSTGVRQQGAVPFCSQIFFYFMELWTFWRKSMEMFCLGIMLSSPFSHLLLVSAQPRWSTWIFLPWHRQPNGPQQQHGGKCNCSTSWCAYLISLSQGSLVVVV